MDLTSLLGLALALAGIFVGHTLDGGKFSSLFQPAAFAIVVVGTFGAVLLQTKSQAFVRGVRMLRWVFATPPDRRQALAEFGPGAGLDAADQDAQHVVENLDLVLAEPFSVLQEKIRHLAKGIDAPLGRAAGTARPIVRQGPRRRQGRCARTGRSLRPVHRRSNRRRHRSGRA